MRASKRRWVAPHSGQIGLAEARDKIEQAATILGNSDPSAAELRDLLEAINKELLARGR